MQAPCDKRPPSRQGHGGGVPPSQNKAKSPWEDVDPSGGRRAPEEGRQHGHGQEGARDGAGAPWPERRACAAQRGPECWTHVPCCFHPQPGPLCSVSFNRKAPNKAQDCRKSVVRPASLSRTRARSPPRRTWALKSPLSIGREPRLPRPLTPSSPGMVSAL